MTADLDPSAESFPLTQRQSLMWIDRQLSPAVPYHNVAHLVRLTGALDADRFERAYLNTARDLDQLRLQIDPETPRQRILPPADPAVRLTRVDLRGAPESIDGWIGRRIAVPFDFSAPPVDAVLIQVGADEHVFYLGEHHIVTDGISFLTIVDTLADHYAGRPVRARPSFREYVTFEHGYRASPRAAAAAKFWDRKLAGGVPPLHYYGRVRARTSIGVERLYLDCGPARAARLASLAESPAIQLLGAEYSRLIALSTVMFAFTHRATGNRELVLGTPTANRSHALGSTCGLLMEQLFLKVEIGDNETFASLARKVRSDLAVSLRYAQYCASDRGLEYPMLNILAKRTPTDFAGLRAEVDLREAWAFEALPPGIAGDGRNTFLVQIHEFEPTRTLVLGLDFHKETFDPALRLAAREHFLKLLDAFLADPETRISTVDLLDAAAREQVWSAGRGERPARPAVDLVRAVAEQAARRPDQPAVIARDANLSYRDLDDRSSQLSAKLAALGVQPGSRVAICLPRGADEILAMLAALKTGATYVPIDAAHPSSRIQMILEDAAPQTLVTHRALLPALGSAATSAPQVLLLDEAWPEIRRGPISAPGGDHADRLAYILFTSGSTGRPKGVEIGRRAFSNFLRSMAHTPGLTETDRLLAITTTTFDISGLELFLPLWVGATVDIADRETSQDPRRLRQHLDREPITVLQATPATWRLLIEAGWTGKRPLKMLCGGEALSPALAGDLLSRGSELWNMYGPTETTVWSTLKRVEPGAGAITIGRPIDNTDVFIVDEALGLVPPGIVGEIVIGGDGLARGYHRRDDLTADRFVTGPRGAAAGRIYRTGDLGRLRPDGELECLGRIDHQVKIRGFRIELGEIEAVLRSVAEVREVLVMARVDGPGDPRLVAYWVGGAERAALQAEARARLPHYMQPTGYVKLEAFPLNTNGKVDRKVLPAPGDDGNELTQAIALPRSDLECRIAAIWRDLLRVKAVGIDQDFFSLGGTSVLAIELCARIEREVGTELPLGPFFRRPTIEGLVAHLSQGSEKVSADSPIVVDLRRGSANREPLFCLLGVHLYQALAMALEGDRPVIGMHIPFRYRPGVDPRPTVDEMAVRYARMIQERQPHGPYHLLGLCYGGIVAYATARQLEQRGEKVELVAVLDGMLPRGPRVTAADRAREFLRTTLGSPNGLRNALQRRMDHVELWLKQLRAAAAGPGAAQLVDVEIDGPKATIEARRFSNSVTPTKGRLMIIRATREPRPSWVPAHLGWQDLAARLVTHDVPSTHFDLLREPAVRTVAAAVGDLLGVGESPQQPARVAQ